VKAIPPVIIILSTLSIRLSISLILSLTLAPPRMTRSGLSGFSTIFEKYSSSFLIKNPAARIGNLTPVIEL
jgi:hypothetical protein